MSRKVALITGAASGIGQALAVAYARTGVAVVGGYYPADPHDPQTTVALVEEAGGECLMLPLDVGDTALWIALAAQAVEHFGQRLGGDSRRRQRRFAAPCARCRK